MASNSEAENEPINIKKEPVYFICYSNEEENEEDLYYSQGESNDLNDKMTIQDDVFINEEDEEEEDEDIRDIQASMSWIKEVEDSTKNICIDLTQDEDEEEEASDSSIMPEDRKNKISPIVVRTKQTTISWPSVSHSPLLLKHQQSSCLEKRGSSVNKQKPDLDDSISIIHLDDSSSSDELLVCKKFRLIYFLIISYTAWNKKILTFF
jgi:hypothetical protein